MGGFKELVVLPLCLWGHYSRLGQSRSAYLIRVFRGSNVGVDSRGILMLGRKVLPTKTLEGDTMNTATANTPKASYWKSPDLKWWAVYDANDLINGDGEVDMTFLSTSKTVIVTTKNGQEYRHEHLVTAKNVNDAVRLYRNESGPKVRILISDKREKVGGGTDKPKASDNIKFGW